MNKQHKKARIHLHKIIKIYKNLKLKKSKNIILEIIKEDIKKRNYFFFKYRFCIDYMLEIMLKDGIINYKRGHKMKKIYIDLDTGRRVADSLPELDNLQNRPDRVAAFLVPSCEDYNELDQYTHAKRVPIW